MRVIALAGVFLCVFSPSSYAEGALVAGWRNGVESRSYSINYRTQQEAVAEALRQCTQAGLANCAIVSTFRNSCIYAMANFTIGVSGIILTQAEVNIVLSECRARGFACQVQQQICDTVDEAAIRQAEIEEQAANRRLLQEQYEEEQRQKAEAERRQREAERARELEAARQQPIIPPKPQEVTRNRELELARQQAEAAKKLAQDTAEELRRLKEAQSRTVFTQLAERPYLVTFIVGGGAFSILLAHLAWRNRRAFLQWLPSRAALAAASPPEATRDAIENPPAPGAEAAPSPFAAPIPIVASKEVTPLPVAARPAPDQPPRDTPAAIEALQLAFAYLQEVDFKGLPDAASIYLNTIALAGKQIAIAEKADPDATFALENDDSSTSVVTVNELKAHALFKEGVCYAETDPKRAVRILEQAAALDPHNAAIYYWIGILHTQVFNKGRAIEALEKAVAIEPRDIDYRKALDRARNISGSQIAFDRTASATRTTFQIVRWLPLALFLFGVISFIVAVNTGDGQTAFAIFAVFAIAGLVLKGVDFIKAWFKANL